MDRATVGFVAGLAGDVIIGVIAMAMNILGLCKICLIALGGGVFQQQLLQEPVGLGWILLGWVSHLIISASLGVGIAVMFTYLGEKRAVLKGAFFGSVVWYLLIGIFAPLAGYLPESPKWIELFIVFGYHIAFGGLVAYLIVRYGNTEKIT
ncbi:MAG: hypothetical protein KGZ63_10260 [Clostridiales bacterium]|jgi:Na+/proline symporter|nr:hypothetical protein [Clostridiales bacterium]